MLFLNGGGMPQKSTAGGSSHLSSNNFNFQKIQEWDWLIQDDVYVHFCDYYNNEFYIEGIE